MALADYFAAPLGLLALSALLALVALYLINRRPAEMTLPTLQFLERDTQRAGTRSRLDRLRRSVLFVLQAGVLLLAALALAGPYLTVDAGGTGETVLVVDASASMATETGDGTRFARATAAAAGDAGDKTSVVVADDASHVLVRERGTRSARAALGSLRVTEAPGDLAAAVSLAAGAADSGTTVHVYSDFADASDWQTAVAAARAQGARVVLHRFGDGGSENVGIVDRTFSRTSVTATVANTGDRPGRRTVSLGGASRTVSLQPGDRTTVTFEVPPGGGRLALSPRDSFPVDDAVPVAAPADAGVRVLVLTSGENRFLRTALGVVDGVTVRVERLPASVGGEFDVVVFSDVQPDELLAGNRELARETLRDGGGVVVTGQQSLGRLGLADLLPVAPGGVATSDAPVDTVEDPLTEGISFPPPGEHVAATLTDGRALVRARGGTPLVATGTRFDGRVLYYGYVDSETAAFPYEVGYPVFWKRAVDYAAGRPSLSDLNRRTGDLLTFPTPTTVGTPAGRVTARSVPLRQVGVYDLPGGEVAAGLSSLAESRVRPSDANDDIENGAGGGPGNGSDGPGAGGDGERRRQSLVPLAVALALVLLVAELAYLVRRGDL